MPDVYVAAGSNIEPERNLARAVGEIERQFPGVRFSPWYRNTAAGFEGDDFVNLVAGFSTELPLAQALETLCGRPRDAARWAPRSMDLDVLLYGNLVCDEVAVKLPRPDLLRRAYMLGPLAAIAPQVLHPTAGRTIGELWRDFDQAAHPLKIMSR